MKVKLTDKGIENINSSIDKCTKSVKEALSPKITPEGREKALALARRRSSMCLLCLRRYLTDPKLTAKLEGFLMGNDKDRYIMDQLRDIKLGLGIKLN
jgi:hypothetical protein